MLLPSTGDVNVDVVLTYSVSVSLLLYQPCTKTVCLFIDVNYCVLYIQTCAWASII